MDISKYTITGIHRGEAEARRAHLLYAKLHDENGKLVTNASLDYIMTLIMKMSMDTYRNPTD